MYILQDELKLNEWQFSQRKYLPYEMKVKLLEKGVHIPDRFYTTSEFHTDTPDIFSYVFFPFPDKLYILSANLFLPGRFLLPNDIP